MCVCVCVCRCVQSGVASYQGQTWCGLVDRWLTMALAAVVKTAPTHGAVLFVLEAILSTGAIVVVTGLFGQTARGLQEVPHRRGPVAWIKARGAILAFCRKCTGEATEQHENETASWKTKQREERQTSRSNTRSLLTGKLSKKLGPSSSQFFVQAHNG